MLLTTLLCWIVHVPHRLHWLRDGKTYRNLGAAPRVMKIALVKVKVRRSPA